MRLHIDAFGQGPPAILVHGIFSWGLDSFPRQRDLADAYRIHLVDRVGYGLTPRGPDESAGWPVDGPSLVEVLESVGPSHLVGHSYGAVVALLAAGRRPDLVRSLILIEPLLFDVATDRPAVNPVLEAFRSVFAGAPGMTAQEFWGAFRVATGFPPPTAADLTKVPDPDWRAIDNTRHEAWPGDAPIDFGPIDVAPWPKVVVLGTAPVAGSREATRIAFQHTARVVAERIAGRTADFEGSGHSPQLDEPDRFNELMRDVWRGI